MVGRWGLNEEGGVCHSPGEAHGCGDDEERDPAHEAGEGEAGASTPRGAVQPRGVPEAIRVQRDPALRIQAGDDEQEQRCNAQDPAPLPRVYREVPTTSSVDPRAHREQDDTQHQRLDGICRRGFCHHRILPDH